MEAADDNARKRKRSTRKDIDYSALGQPSTEELELDDTLESIVSLIADEEDDVLEDSSWDKPLTKTAENKLRAKKKAKIAAKPKPTKKEKEKKPLPFLQLPAELRDQIYELALVEPNGLKLVSRTKHNRQTVGRGIITGYAKYQRRWTHWGGVRQQRVTNTTSKDIMQRSENPKLTTNLLAVCKQIHSEAVGYLYQQEIFLADTSTMHTFLAIIGATNRLQLHELVVCSWASDHSINKMMNFAAFTMLSDCTNLQSLYLDCDLSNNYTPQKLARHIHHIGHYWLESFGAANDGKDAALDVLEINEGNFKHMYPSRRGFNQTLTAEEAEKQFRKELRELLGCEPEPEPVPEPASPSAKRARSVEL